MHDLTKDIISTHDKFAQLLGIELAEVGPGHAVARMPVTDDLKNSLGIVHGGATFALADLAFAAASNSHGRVAVAINVSIAYVAAGTGSMLTATARETSLTPKLATYTVTIADDSGETVAIFDGMVYRKRETLRQMAESVATGSAEAATEHAE